MMAFAYDHERLRQSRRRVINELNVSDSDANVRMDALSLSFLFLEILFRSLFFRKSYGASLMEMFSLTHLFWIA